MKLTEKLGITFLGLALLTGSFMLGQDFGRDEGRQEVMNAINSYYLDRLFPEEITEETKKEAYKGRKILLDLSNNARSKSYPEFSPNK